MLTLVGPSSSVHFTSLSTSSIPPLQAYLSNQSPSSSKAHLHTSPILSVLPSLSPPVPQSRVCLLDPKATQVISPDDASLFDVFLYGGILGDDPPRDRTSELRKLGFEGRHLGPVQMTTDTAVGVTKIVVEDGIPLDQIKFIVRSLPSFFLLSLDCLTRVAADDRTSPLSLSTPMNPSKCLSDTSRTRRENRFCLRG